MKALKHALMLVLVALAPTTAHAADTGGRFAVRGLGSSKCSDLTTVIGQKNTTLIQLYAAWLAGYVTASNRLISQTFDAIPSTVGSDVVGLVSVICARNPNALVETSTYQVLEALNAIRVRQDSPVVTMQEGGKTLAIRQEALTLVQTELASKGLYKGPADGKPSPALVKAISAFQKAQKLPETGLPDIDVLVRLKMAPSKP
jgi:hypothetical protein